MYIFKNSLVSILRNKGRNVLIGIIILVIACSTTVTLAIRNTADNLVKKYEESHDIVGTISFNRGQLAGNFKGGEDARRENIESFNNIQTISIDDIKKYGESEFLKDYYYMYATSLNSDTLTKATDSYEYEVENKETSSKTSTSTSSTPPSGDFGPGKNMGQWGERHTTTNTETTITITKSKERFESSRNLTGDFELDGYSSYDAMENFKNGSYRVTDGEIFSDLSSFECVINEELATLNELQVGSTITLKNSNNDTTYDFIVKGIYKDNTDEGNSSSMYSKSVNTIITGNGVIEKIVADDETIVTNITPSFIFYNEEGIEQFSNEIKEKGLGEYYQVTTNINELQNATKSIENVKTFSLSFLVITLTIAAVVLFVINMINIRERKYEIGVFRTIGVSKFKLTMQFILELLIVSIIMLSIGAGLGSYLSRPVGNMLLQNEMEASRQENEQISNNFGKPGMEMNHNSVVKIEQIDTIDAVVDFKVVGELLGIGIVLILVSSLASMISIQRFSPLTILKERS